MMSDHGARFANRDSEEGKIEERKPMFGFRFPDWFKEKYADKVSTFISNAAERLVTPFDIHATFHHLLDLSQDKCEIPHHKHKRTRGLSLFQEIPKSRSCADADIEPHWCACLSSTPMDVDSIEAAKVIKASVDYLNSLTQPHRDQCVELTLGRLVSIASLSTNDNLRKFKKSKDKDGFVPDLTDTTKQTVKTYQLKFVTKPNDGTYELTTSARPDGTLLFDKNQISRTNMYGNQPDCIASKFPHMRKYCYCKNLL